MRSLAFAFWLLISAAAAAQTAVPWRLSTPDLQRLNAAAFVDFDCGISERLADMRSVVVVLSGRVAYEHHRDGNPGKLRDIQSVAKTLAPLVGTARRQGPIALLDHPVLDGLPELQTINADPRAQAITLQHLLSMTAGFAVDDARGPRRRWTRRAKFATPQPKFSPTPTAWSTSSASALNRLLMTDDRQELTPNAKLQALVETQVPAVASRPARDSTVKSLVCVERGSYLQPEARLVQFSMATNTF